MKPTWTIETEFFPPHVTLMAFLSQVISQDGSCRATVLRVISDRVADGDEACSANTSNYVRARQRLPLELIRGLCKNVGAKTEDIQVVEERWLWKRRHVKLLDGSTLLAPDTPENREAFPIHGKQNQEVGFPIIRVSALISLSTGCLLDFDHAPYQGKQTGELSLARNILPTLREGDILLGDAMMDTFFFMAQLKRQGVDVLFEMKAHRCLDFRYGTRLSKGDRFITLKKPQRPTWMSKTEYQSYADFIQVRMIQDGERTLITTLLDPREHKKRELRKLYSRRWSVELDLRCIKDIMGMEMLRCKTPDMLEKEIWTYLLAYNLVRLLMAQAAEIYQKEPRKLSFKGTVQAINTFVPKIQMAQGRKKNEIFQVMLSVIASQSVGNRPGRKEPRAVKRRPKPFPRLHISRKKWHELHAA